ncbi:collagen-binding domain-containing protein [Streptomyces sp. EN23]|uniref:collagen-binding domain-containing protein n=1 Tax=Streptomyces sp. EN23 TaxID=212774 RepID=UPI00159F2AE0|nr:collagen-binding domain-containing protein [Streptomyces sp. EN23]
MCRRVDVPLGLSLVCLCQDLTGGGYDSTSRIGLTTQQPAGSVARSGLMDFLSLFTACCGWAGLVATCANTVTLLDAAQNPLPGPENLPSGSQVCLELVEGQADVLRLTGEQLSNVSVLTFRGRPTVDTPLLIDVDATETGGDFTWNTPTMAGVSGTDASYILWNFADATDITIADGDFLEGTIFAPNADLTDLDPANIEGGIIVSSLVAGRVDPLLPLRGRPPMRRWHRSHAGTDLTPAPTDVTPRPTDAGYGYGED